MERQAMHTHRWAGVDTGGQVWTHACGVHMSIGVHKADTDEVPS